MKIDLPDVVAEVTAAFNRYEKALVTNDVAVLDDTFRVDPRTIRYGGAEILYGHDEIAAFRAARAPVGLARTISRTVITAYGRECAVASTLFHRATLPGKIGRQMHSQRCQVSWDEGVIPAGTPMSSWRVEGRIGGPDSGEQGTWHWWSAVDKVSAAREAAKRY